MQSCLVPQVCARDAVDSVIPGTSLESRDEYIQHHERDFRALPCHVTPNLNAPDTEMAPILANHMLSFVPYFDLDYPSQDCPLVCFGKLRIRLLDM